MKEKNLFDILEDAENYSMKRLIEKCPEISDEQLDRIFAKSEKKFRDQKAEKERTERSENIKMKNNDIVEGVEHSKRPAWLAPLSTAASILLIAGIAVGSTLMLKRNTKPGGDDGIVTPAVTVTTSTGTGTNTVSTDKNGSAITVPKTTTTTTTVSSSAGTAENDKAADTKFIEPFVGRWRYEMSSINNLDIPESAVYMGTAEINSDGTYTYTDISGNVTHGTISNATEEIGGTELQCLDFSGNEFSANDFLFNRAYYVESRPYELHFGNSNIARLVREGHTVTVETNWKSAYRRELLSFMNSGEINEDSRWDLQDIDNDGTPELLISRAMFHVAGVRVYYYENGSAMPIRYTNGDSYEYGAYGAMQICPEESLVGVSNIHMGYEYFDTCKYENHSITQIQILSNNENNRDYEEVVYSIDHKDVSKEEHDKALSARSTKNWKVVGQQYYFGDFSPLL